MQIDVPICSSYFYERFQVIEKLISMPLKTQILQEKQLERAKHMDELWGTLRESVIILNETKFNI